MATSRYLVSFRSAAVLVEVKGAEYARAVAALEPFLFPVVAGNADEYAAAAQSVSGQEYSVSDAIAAGLLTEDGEPCDGVEIFRAE